MAIMPCMEAIMHRETVPKSTVCQQLYLGLARTLDGLRRQMETALKAYGLSEAQYNVLCILKEAYPKALSCGELSANLITRDPDVSRLLDRLEQAGLIERKRGAPDRRISYANILPAGLQLLSALKEPMAELHERQFAYLASEETHGLFYHLRQIKQEFEPGALETSWKDAPRQGLVSA
jgi:DNA-binding MarR family transcriptional regulator